MAKGSSRKPQHLVPLLQSLSVPLHLDHLRSLIALRVALKRVEKSCEDFEGEEDAGDANRMLGKLKRAIGKLERVEKASVGGYLGREEEVDYGVFVEHWDEVCTRRQRELIDGGGGGGKVHADGFWDQVRREAENCGVADGGTFEDDRLYKRMVVEYWKDEKGQAVKAGGGKEGKNKRDERNRRKGTKGRAIKYVKHDKLVGFMFQRDRGGGEEQLFRSMLK